MHPKGKKLGISAIGGAVASLAIVGGCGIFGQNNSNQITSRPTQFIIWGDPTSDVTSRSISDAPPVQTGLAVSTDGQVAFANGSVCNNCNVNVDTAEFFIDGELRGSIRWTDIAGNDGMIGTSDDGRFPFLVDTEGFILDVDLASSDGVRFRETATQFETPDDPSDDTAFRFGEETVASGSNTSGLCGTGMGAALITMALALGAIGRWKSLVP
jgi:hypothetical protein